MSRFRSLILLSSTVLLGWLGASSVSAQSGQDGARAEALFRDARRLMQAEDYAEACPKFAASYKFDPAVGTLLNLADCHDKLGLTASAWAEFLEAATLARRAGHAERAQEAAERAAELEPRLVRVKVIVPVERRIDGLEIRQDGSLIDSATWNTAVPIDPGPHLLSVSAPKKKEWAKAFDAVGEGQTIQIEVPELEDAPEEPEAATPLTPGVEGPPEAVGESSSTAQRTIGIILTGTGAVGMAFGGFFGLSAYNKWDKAGCSSGICPTSERQTLAEDAKTHGNLSTGFFIGGGLLSAVGIVLIATAPSGSERKAPSSANLKLSPSVGPQATGLWLGGQF